MNGNQRNNGPSFSLRRLLLQGARIVRGNTGSSSGNSSNSGQPKSCDLEKGAASTSSTVTGAGKSRNDSSNPTIKVNVLDASSCSSSSAATSNPNGAKLPIPHDSSPKLRIGCGSFSSVSTITNHQQQPEKEELSQTTTKPTTTPLRSDSLIGGAAGGGQQFVCPICYNSPSSLYILFTCKHIACQNCLLRYLKNEINEFRTEIACPQCSEAMHPSDIEQLLQEQTELINKYENFMVRRYLLSDPDSRWCPAPDCSYAVIATGCASCPRIKCMRSECGIQFCYHCKAEWHPDQTCDAARTSRKLPSESLSQNRDDIKPCPKCQVLIVKMDDGSCNHMVCSICNVEFCWLCMKEITDLHYLSPSGCTFWGTKPWSRKKKLMWQLGTLVGAPVGIALVAGIAVPAMIIGIPVWAGKKCWARYKTAAASKRSCVVMSCVLGAMVVSPILAGLAVAIGVPILLFYVYGVVPVSLCRAGCDTSNRDEVNEYPIEETDIETGGGGGGTQNGGNQSTDGTSSVDALSRIGAISIGDVSLSATSGSQIVGGGGAGSLANYSATNFILCNSSLRYDRESTKGLAGSILCGQRMELQTDSNSLEENASGSHISNDTASIRALNGSIY